MSEVKSSQFSIQSDCLIKAGLETQIITPQDPEYAILEDSYWSNDAKIKPNCIVRPRSAHEVSTALKALVAAEEKFAIRSGGHTTWSGSNNITGGVTIDLGLISHINIDLVSGTVDLGPGNRWGHVYRTLQESGITVAGGRVADVGVSGLILGGGLSYLTARRGFACDNVVAFEVVLADGSIITADRENHVDLFRALKGGSNNFGIVTNFTMTTIQIQDIWGGVTMFSKDHAPAAIEALYDFTSNVSKYPNDNLINIFSYNPAVQDIIIASAYINMRGDEASPAFDKWLAIPELSTTRKITRVAQVAADYPLPSHNYNMWMTLAFKNDTRIVSKTVELHAKMVEELKAAFSDGQFVTQCLFQPLPKIFAEYSVRAGGNVFGLERYPHDGIILLATIAVPTADKTDLAYAKVKTWVQEVKEFAQTIDDGLADWIYLNYADKSQDVLASYGADNVRFMKDVAHKYDPQQVFQKLCPGGFKLSEVQQ